MGVQGFRYTALTHRARRINNFLWMPGWLPAGAARSLAEFVLGRAYAELEKLEPDPLLSLRVHPDQAAIFARQLATMVRAGVPLHQSVQFLSEGENEAMEQAAQVLARRLESGHGFANSLARLPGVFPPIFHGFARVGETSGRLVQALESLAGQLEKLVWMKRRVRGAIGYPIILMLGAIALSGVLVFGIVPMMTPTLLELGVELPALTRWLLWLTEAGSNPFLVTFVVVFVAFHLAWLSFAFGETGRHTDLRIGLDALLLRIPVVSKLCRRYASARVMSSTSVCVDTGISVTKALLDSSPLAGNVILEHGIRKTCRAVNEGASLGEALEEYKVLSGAETQLIICALESGDLAGSLRTLAKLAEEEVESTIDTFSALLEPIILGAMSVVVGIVTLATFLPWMELLQSLG